MIELLSRRPCYASTWVKRIILENLNILLWSITLKTFHDAKKYGEV